jgi:hypothetical protein
MNQGKVSHMTLNLLRLSLDFLVFKIVRDKLLLSINHLSQ